MRCQPLARLAHGYGGQLAPGGEAPAVGPDRPAPRRWSALAHLVDRVGHWRGAEKLWELILKPPERGRDASLRLVIRIGSIIISSPKVSGADYEPRRCVATSANGFLKQLLSGLRAYGGLGYEQRTQCEYERLVRQQTGQRAGHVT